ncbi:hypothetical protein MRX96_026375 [Rhipicephalus microplus]
MPHPCCSFRTGRLLSTSSRRLSPQNSGRTTRQRVATSTRSSKLCAFVARSLRSPRGRLRLYAAATEATRNARNGKPSRAASHCLVAQHPDRDREYDAWLGLGLLATPAGRRR